MDYQDYFCKDVWNLVTSYLFDKEPKETKDMIDCGSFYLFKEPFEKVAELHADIVWASAAWAGNLNVIKLLHRNQTKECSPSVMTVAAWNGNLDVVKWLHKNRKEGCLEDTLDWVARFGHLDVLTWFHENRKEEISSDAITWAAEEGHLDIVMWLSLNEILDVDDAIHVAKSAEIKEWLKNIKEIYNDIDETAEWVRKNQLANATLERLLGIERMSSHINFLGASIGKLIQMRRNAKLLAG